MHHHRTSQKEQTKQNISDLSPEIRDSIYAMRTIHGHSPRRVAQHHGVTIEAVCDVVIQLVHDRAYEAGRLSERNRLWRKAA